MDFTLYRPAKAGEVARVSTPDGERRRIHVTACPGHLIRGRVRDRLLARLLRGRRLPFRLPAGKAFRPSNPGAQILFTGKSRLSGKPAQRQWQWT